MPEEKPPTEPRASPPGRATMPPRDRFGYNDPPNQHISRDTPLALQMASEQTPVATVTTVAGTGVSATGASMSEGPIVQHAQPPSFQGPPEVTSVPFFETGTDLSAGLRRQAVSNAAVLSATDEVVLPPPPAPPDPSQWDNKSSWDAAAQIARSRAGLSAAALAGSGHIVPTTADVVASSGARLSGHGELTVTPEPVTTVPTPYPLDPAAPLIVSNYVQIDVRSAEFGELNAKLDRIIGLLDRSNQFPGDTQKQLAAEIQAGQTLLTAPRPDRNLIDLLLTHPLHFIATAAAGAVIGNYAIEALQLLQKILEAKIPL